MEMKKSVNRGNHVELLRFTTEHMEKSIVFKGLSNQIQNNLIEAVSSALLWAIKYEIKEVCFVAVLVEITDVSNKVQFSIVLRYFHRGKIKERFLRLSDISCDWHAQAIAEIICQFLTEFECSEKLGAPVYDGIATMAGNLNGV